MADISKETLALLGKGHVWRRVDTGRQSTVLYLANTRLKGAAAKRNPPMVVYLDDMGKINAVPIESYIENREYITINVYMEDMLEKALQDPPQEPNLEDLVGNIASESQAQGEGAEPMEGDWGDLGGTTEEPAPSELVAVFTAAGSEEPVIDAITLAGSILQYEQDPDIDMENPARSRIRHKLVVAQNGFTLDDLNSVFTPSGEAQGYYPVFSINGIVVDWVAYHGAYPVVSPDGMFASIIFTTPMAGDFEEELFIDEMPAPIAPAEPEMKQDPEPVADPVTEQREPELRVRVETKYEQQDPSDTVLAALSTVATKASVEVDEDPVLKIIDDDEPVVVAGQGNSPADDQRDDTEALFGNPAPTKTVQPEGMAPFQFKPQVVRK